MNKLFNFFLLLIFTNISAYSLDKFHICTVANYRHPNLEKLEKSCQAHGIDLEILGMGSPYPGNGTKFLHMVDYLQTLEEDDIVMFVDAFDVLILADKKTILQKFLKMKVPFLMAAETNSHPFPWRAEEYPQSPTRFRYINTGTYIGYVNALKNWLDALQPIDPVIDDQGQATEHFLASDRNKRYFKLDHHCRLFLPLFGVSTKDVAIINDQFRCLLTGSKPCLIHANGGTFKIWDMVYTRFFTNRFRYVQPWGSRKSL